MSSGSLDLEPVRARLEERAVPARPHECLRLGAAQSPRIGHWPAPERGVVGADDGEPVVVVGALRAVRRRVGPELDAQLQRRLQLVGVEPHERVPEAVHAAVALPARVCVGADACRFGGVRRVEVGRHARDEPVGEARAAARVVAQRQVVHQVRERHVAFARVPAPDGVHDHVAVGQQEAALVPRQVGDRLHAGAGVVAAVEDAEEALREAVTGVLALQITAAREVERPQLRRRVRAPVPDEHGAGHPGHGEQDRRHGDEPEQRAPGHGGHRVASGPPWRAARDASGVSSSAGRS